MTQEELKNFSHLGPEELKRLERLSKTLTPTGIAKEFDRLEERIEEIELTPGPPGEKGERGEKGEMGEKGKPGRDGKDGRNGRDGKPGINGRDGKDGENGKDADEARLEAKLIELEEKIKALKSEVGTIPRRMGMKKITYIRSHRLTDQCNGVTKSFVLPQDTIGVISVHGTQFPENYDPYVDWTLSGRTLTLASSVGAPETGQTLFAIIECQFYA